MSRGGAVGARGPAKLNSVQAARGVAALLVILFHCSMAIFSHPQYWPTDPLHHAFASGHLGVELFFAISGFIILTAHRRDLSQPARLLGYVRKRFLRIYPLYWLVLAAILPVYVVVPSFGGGGALRPLTVLSSILLVHIGSMATILAVSWTLFMEVLFYAAFASLVVDRRFGIAVLGVWWALALARLAIGPVGPLGTYPFQAHVLLFGFGMLVAMLYWGERIACPAALAVIGTVLFVADGLVDTYHPLLAQPGVTLLAGLGAALALAGVTELERRGRLRVPRPLLFLGDASYSIYLVHFLVLSLVAKVLLHRALRIMPPAAAELGLVLIAVAAGGACPVVGARPLRVFFSRGRTKVAPMLVNGPITD